MWYVRPAKPQISACAYAQADQSLCESLENSMTVKQADQTSFAISKLKRRLHRLVCLHFSKYYIVGNHMSQLICV